jgi:hypothetical protein
MLRLWLLLSLVGLGSMALALEELVVLYNGQPLLPPKVLLGDWGFTPRAPGANPLKPARVSGRTYGLRLSTLGRYQGARFDLQAPIDITPLLTSKNTYLEVYLRGTGSGDASKITGDGGTPPPPETYQSAALTGVATEVPPPVPDLQTEVPDGPATDGLPKEFQPVQKKPATVPLPALKNLRFTFITEHGQGLLIVTPDQFFPRDEVGPWIRVDIPLTLINKALPIGGKWTRLLITSDEPTELLLGRLAIVRDNLPLQGSFIVFPPFLEAGKRIFFAARVETGLSRYEVHWDFDTKAGVTIDATGDRVTYVFDTEGNYLITCTIRDVTGGKEPVSSTLEVKVSRPLDK